MTQKEKIKTHLQKKGKITSWEAIQEYRITRLSEYIRALRSEGMEIESIPQKSERGKPFALYRFEKELSLFT